MKLVRYEWKKTFAGKIRWIFLALFCLNLGVYYIYMIPSMPTDEQRATRQKWEQVLANRNEDVESSLRFIEAEQDKLIPEPEEGELPEAPDEQTRLELGALFDISQEYTAVVEYRQFIDGLKERAEYMKGVSIFHKEGGFSLKNIEKTVKDFERVEHIEIQPMDDTGMEKLHQFYLTDLLVILFVCLLCFQEYGSDGRSGMGNLIQGTPNGKRKLRLAQIQAVGLGVLGAGFLFYGTNFLVTGLTTGFGNLSYYVQGMPMFRNVSFPCTVGWYLVLYLIWKLAAMVFVSLVFQLFAIWFNGKSMAWILSGVVLAASFGMWFYLPDSPVAKLFRYLNLMGLLDVGQIIGNYQNLKVFETPVLLLHAAILFMAVVSVWLIAGILLVKRMEWGKLRIEFPVRKHKRLWKRVFTYEFHKAVVHQRAWAVLAALFCVSLLYAGPGEPHISVTEYYYENHVKEYEGIYTAEKAKAVEQVWESGQFADADEAAAAERLYQQSEYLKTLKDDRRGYVNQRVFGELFLKEQQDTKHMLMIVIAVLLSVSGLFYQDRKKQMEQLLCTTPKERSVYWNKVKTGALVGGLSSLMVWGIAYIRYFRQYDVKGLSLSIRSIPEFAKLGYGGSIVSYVVISFLLRVVIGMYIGVLLGFLAQVFQVPTQNIICGILMFVLPLCMCYIGQMGYEENPLIQFINRYLAPILQPIKFLSAFPTQWFLAGTWKLCVFACVPAACMYAGLRIWEKK